MNILRELKDDEVASYFRNLGFTVTWDFSKSGSEWYGPPLDVILAELYAEYSGIPTNNIDWNIVLNATEETFKWFMSFLPPTPEHHEYL